MDYDMIWLYPHATPVKLIPNTKINGIEIINYMIALWSICQ